MGPSEVLQEAVQATTPRTLEDPPAPACGSASAPPPETESGQHVPRVFRKPGEPEEPTSADVVLLGRAPGF